jgi:hypothetical protein
MICREIGWGITRKKIPVSEVEEQMGKKSEIPLSKVQEYFEKVSKMGVWGGVLVNFEEGSITKIIEEFVWTGNDADSDFSSPSHAIKAALSQSTTKKKLVIRAGGIK